jgi:hypothetical protein
LTAPVRAKVVIGTVSVKDRMVAASKANALKLFDIGNL